MHISKFRLKKICLKTTFNFRASLLRQAFFYSFFLQLQKEGAFWQKACIFTDGLNCKKRSHCILNTAASFMQTILDQFLSVVSSLVIIYIKVQFEYRYTHLAFLYFSRTAC